MSKYIWTANIPVERSIGGVVVDTENVNSEVELFIPEVTVKANAVAVCPVYMRYINTQQLIKCLEFQFSEGDPFVADYEQLAADPQFDGVKVVPD